MDKICFFIDDDVDDRDLFRLALRSASVPVTVETAANGREALHKLVTDRYFMPHFIFLDLNMPLMGGKEFLQEIKKITRLKDIPVYIYTTSANDKEKHETRALGAVEFIIKPYDIDDIARTVADILKELPPIN